MRSDFPASATRWLTPEPPGRLLVIGAASASVAHAALALGNQVVAFADEPSHASALCRKIATPYGVAGDFSNLPFATHSFDGIIISQALHRIPLDSGLAQMARVLRPGGQLGVAYTIRDDSVPWVRRLADILHTVDPNAMSGRYGHEILQRLSDSPWFPEQATKDFRLWFPISRSNMLAMVERQSAVSHSAVETRKTLLDEVGALFDNYARSAELKLPYRVCCWRGFVDHGADPEPPGSGDEGLKIQL